MSYATLDRRDLCDLARFRILDARNCNEAAKDRLLLAMADEIDRWRSWVRDHGQHDESNGPCYGRKNPHPDPDDSCFECRCGLSDLLRNMEPKR